MEFYEKTTFFDKRYEKTCKAHQIMEKQQKIAKNNRNKWQKSKIVKKLASGREQVEKFKTVCR